MRMVRAGISAQTLRHTVMYTTKYNTHKYTYIQTCAHRKRKVRADAFIYSICFNTANKSHFLEIFKYL